MKKTILLAVMMMAVLSANAQLGYWYKSTFIELVPNDNTYCYVQPKNGTSKDDTKKILADIEDKYQILTHFDEDGMVIKAQERPEDERLYTSYYYKSSRNKGVIVMPQISLRIKEGFSITEIERKYDGILQLVCNDKGRCVFLCNVSSSEEVMELSMRIHDEEGVKWCEPVKISNNMQCNTLYPQQYYLNGNGLCSIKAEPAWQMISMGSPYIRVAVIDDGVDDNHEDMFLCVLPGYTVNDNSGSWGRPKNENSYNNKGHGTCCSGIISAIDNTIGIKGIAQYTSILPVNIFPNAAYDGYEGGASSAQIADAIRWAYPRADILNFSWKVDESDDIEDAITDALSLGRSGKGCIVVASAGNDYDGTQTSVAFPASIDGVIAVGAIISTGVLDPGSRRGNGLDLVALDDAIQTIDRMGNLGYVPENYYAMGGTSATCPQVAGVAALMLAADSTLTGSQVRDIINSSCQKRWSVLYYNDTIYYQITSWITDVGNGLLDAEKSVFKSLQLSISGPTVPENPSVYSVQGLGTATYPVTWSWETPCSIPIIQDSPSVNQCSISNANKAYINNTLVATITLDNETIRTVKKPIKSGANFTGTYSQMGGMVNYGNGNVYFYEPIPSTPISDGGSAYIHRGIVADFFSNLFNNANFYSENGHLSLSWSHSGNHATYMIPISSNTFSKTFVVKCTNSYDVFKFTVYRIVDGLSPFDPLAGINLQIGDGTVIVNANLLSQEEEVLIANVKTGKVVYQGILTSSSQTISTKGWPSGLYVLRILGKEEAVSQKFYVK